MAMMPRSSGDDDSGFAPLAEINVTPMVDVMLVLLVIFMVAAPLMTVGVPVQLPKTSAEKVSQPKQPTIVSLDRDGKIFLAKEELPADLVVQRLAPLAAADPGQTVLVRGDASVDYGRVMALMGQLGQAGFTRISLIAQGAPAAAPPATP
jgi:biopolymer transport protein TolR